MALRLLSATGRDRRRPRIFAVEQLPVFFQLKGKLAAVTGGGTAAARRAELALRAGARVLVFSESLSGEFRQLASHKGFEHRPKAPELADIQDVALIFCASGDRQADEAVWRLAKQAKI